MGPYTVYNSSFVDVANMDDYSMRPNGTYPGRTYRIYEGPPPLWPFGWGLSYSSWDFSWHDGGRPVTVRASSLAPFSSYPFVTHVVIANRGPYGGARVVMAFLSTSHGGVADPPVRTLIGLAKVFVPAGSNATVSFSSNEGADLGFCGWCSVDPSGVSRHVLPGVYTL